MPLCAPPGAASHPPGSREDVAAEASDLAQALLLPNAMFPRGGGVFDQDALARLADGIAGKAMDEGGICAFDARGAFVRSFDDESALDSPVEIDRGYDVTAVVVGSWHCRSFTSSRSDGLRDAQWQPVTDPVTAFAGLVRVDADGIPVVAADAPLAVQFAALYDAIVFSDMTEVVDGVATAKDPDPKVLESLADHIAQLMVTAEALSDAFPLDAGACIDIEVLRDLAVTGAHADVRDAALDLEMAVERARPGDPRWKLGGLGGCMPSGWVARDEPGSGLEWKTVDENFARSFPDAASRPSSRAERLHPTSEASGKVREFVRSLGPTARNGRSTLAAYEAGRLHLCLFDEPGDPILVAWPMDGDEEERSDPLMSERLGGSEHWNPLPPPLGTAAFEEGFLALMSTGLLGSLPEPETFPDYAFVVLAHAHERGLRIPDFLASLASVIRDGHADDAFIDEDDASDDYLDEDDFLDEDDYEDDTDEGDPDEDAGDAEDDPAVRPETPVEAPVADVAAVATGGDDWLDLTPEEAAARDAVAASAESLGGSPDPIVVAMLKGIDDWDEIDLDRDVRLLRDAYGAGCRIGDMAVAIAYKAEDAED